MAHWYTIGSTGTVDESSVNLIVVDGPAARMKGTIPGQVLAGGTQATVRYTMLPVADSVAGPVSVQVRYRAASDATRVVVRLLRLESTSGAMSEVARFDSSSFGASPSFQTRSIGTASTVNISDGAVYYVEVNLINATGGPLPDNQTPAVAIIRVGNETA